MAERFLVYRKAYPPRKNADGKYLCRVCATVLPGRMRSFCRDQCRDDALIRCGINVRSIVEDRDNGWCARCGVHVPTLEKRIREAFYRHTDNGSYHCWRYYLHGKERERWERFLSRIGINPTHELNKSLWEAHHKHAVKDGGGGAGLDEYETLCHWCHNEETAAQQRRWAEEKRDADGQIKLMEREA